MNQIPVWVQVIIALMAAVGGVGGFVQVLNAIRAWRDGVRQREEAADERMVKRLENRVVQLELKDDQNSEYIRLLIEALGAAGIKIPPRPPSQPNQG